MIALNSMRRPTVVLTCALAAVYLTACGGGGGGSGSSGNGGSGTGSVGGVTPPRTQPIGSTATPPSGSTATRTNTPGGTPASTPVDTATPVVESTPTQTPIIVKGGNLADAIRNTPSGQTLYVAPGSYAALKLRAGDVQGPIAVIADVTGQVTGTSPAPVLIDARGTTSAISLTSVDDLTFDGLTVRGATDSAILVDSGTGITIRNCTVESNDGDGIVVQDSDSTLVFDNLAHDNVGAGIVLLGSAATQVINNTSYNNAQGVFIGSSNTFDSSDVLVKSNIFNKNDPGDGSAAGIVAETASLSGYDGDYNLNTDGYDGPSAGDNDLDADPLFILPSSDDFHVLPPGPDGSGGSPVINKGDPATDGDLVAQLQVRTVRSDRFPDTGRVDIGFHYGNAIASTPTPVPTKTRATTPTRTTAGTAVPTRTPTRTATLGTPAATTAVTHTMTPAQPTATPTATTRNRPATSTPKPPTPTRTPITPKPH